MFQIWYVMVFGRKSAPVKPPAPGVEEILEDLATAGPSDPVFLLVPGIQDVVGHQVQTVPWLVT